ncbi:MAG TPA: hypothetical protein VGM98_12225 [Schlesneria sp.]
MNHPQHSHSHPDKPHGEHGAPSPYWTRAHRDWKFWGVIVMLVAMVVYISTMDLALQPEPQVPARVPQQVP